MASSAPVPGSDYEKLVHAMIAGISDTRSFEDFLCTSRDIFSCDHAAMAFDPKGKLNATPTILVDRPESQVIGEFLYSSEFCKTLPCAMPATASVPLPGIGACQVLGLRIGCEHEQGVYLLLWRHRSDEPFSEAHHALLGHISPLMQCSIKVFDRIVNLTRKQLVTDGALSSADIGAILVSADGEAMLSNSIAAEILEKKDALQIVRGQLRATHPADTTALLGHIRAMAAEQRANADWSTYVPIALPRQSSALPLTVIIRPGPAFGPLNAPLMRTAMLTLRDPERRPVLPVPALARLFGLTPAEALLASELARGSSLDEAAEQLGISRNTTRSQLQAIFSKTNVNRQGDLVRILLSSAATLSR